MPVRPQIHSAADAACESRLPKQNRCCDQNHFSHCDLLFRNFRPVREPYAVRERSSSDKERQGAGNGGCRTMSLRFALGGLKRKGLQEGRWRSRADWAAAAGAPYAVPTTEGGKEPAGMPFGGQVKPTLHVSKSYAVKEGRATLLPKCRRREGVWRGRRDRAWR